MLDPVVLDDEDRLHDDGDGGDESGGGNGGNGDGGGGTSGVRHIGGDVNGGSDERGCKRGNGEGGDEDGCERRVPVVDAATSELAVVADNNAIAAATGNSAVAAAAAAAAAAGGGGGTNAAAAAGASVAVSAMACGVDALMDTSAAAPDDANLTLLRGVLGEGAPRAYLQQLLDDAGNVRWRGRRRR